MHLAYRNECLMSFGKRSRGQLNGAWDDIPKYENHAKPNKWNGKERGMNTLISGSHSHVCSVCMAMWCSLLVFVFLWLSICFWLFIFVCLCLCLLILFDVVFPCFSLTRRREDHEAFSWLFVVYLYDVFFVCLSLYVVCFSLISIDENQEGVK